jgi:hypothetical protein
MNNEWLCIQVSLSYCRGDKDSVVSTVRKMFGDDLKDIRLVCDDIMWLSGEYYCFVKCSNYHSHVSSLKQNPLFLGVVPNCNNPEWLSDVEVEEFAKSVITEKESHVYRRGDVVVVRDGYLKGLTGLVIGRYRKHFRISFHLSMRNFVESLDGKSLRYIGSLFKNRRFPVTRVSFEEDRLHTGCGDPELQEALKKNACHHKIYWKKNRRRDKAM